MVQSAQSASQKKTRNDTMFYYHTKVRYTNEIDSRGNRKPNPDQQRMTIVGRLEEADRFGVTVTVSVAVQSHKDVFVKRTGRSIASTRLDNCPYKVLSFPEKTLDGDTRFTPNDFNEIARKIENEVIEKMANHQYIFECRKHEKLTAVE